jgi:hypothetical protein
LKRKRGLAAVKARDGESDLSFEAAQEAIRAFYGAKIEATRRSLPKREAAAAVRALLIEQSLAFKALAERRQAEGVARRALAQLVADPERPCEESSPNRSTLVA